MGNTLSEGASPMAISAMSNYTVEMSTWARLGATTLLFFTGGQRPLAVFQQALSDSTALPDASAIVSYVPVWISISRNTSWAASGTRLVD